MKAATPRLLGVLDNDGMVVSCTDSARIGEQRDVVEDKICAGGYTYRPLERQHAMPEYTVFAAGEDEEAYTLCVMAGIALNSAKALYDERHDKATFVKNILQGNVMPDELYARARELQINCDKPRVVMLIRQLDRNEPMAADMLQSLFPERNHDFVVGLSGDEIALVKEVREDVDTQNLNKLAAAIEETMGAELYIKTNIGVGAPAMHIKDLAKSFNEARVALEVGKVFETDRSILHYAHLGISRLIYQLPVSLCEMFLKEVFKQGSMDKIDQEILLTIQKLFENNLNISETARQLFVHRNTLVYRLDRMKRTTGLDLRDFEDAVVFKVAYMVHKYLEAEGRRS
ncbi:MAG: helix-turn-helix domain-containing protein [Oscillospiraceae bacterium]|nr:helix-turn-helix domain-containing protein [Oscillospiraceae bacterium]